MSDTALRKTSNLIALYRYAQGTSEVPTAFHLWAFLTALAATVGDRVYLRKFAHSKLAPNLYTVLIGPSGCGKGEAIDAVTPLVRDLRPVNYFEGPITGQGLFKQLDRQRLRGAQNGAGGSKMFLVNEELAMTVGSSDEAKTLIAYVTGLYKPKPKMDKATATEKRAYHLTDHCINWLAGTTRKWLTRVLTLDDFQAGPGRRIVWIEPTLDLSLRVPTPQVPPDRDLVMDHLAQRLDGLAHLEAEVPLAPEAAVWNEQWYLERPPPADEDHFAQWRQADDLGLKLALLCWIADGPYPGPLQYKHLTRGRALAEDGQRAYDEILRYVSITKEQYPLEKIVSILIADGGAVDEPRLLRLSGLSGPFFRTALTTLIQSRRVVTGTIGGVRKYAIRTRPRRGQEYTS